MKSRKDFETEEAYIEWLKTPKRFFSYDPQGSFNLHITAEEAEAEAEKILELYAEEAGDTGWIDAVEDVCWGEIKGEILQTKRIDRKDCEIDEEGYDEQNDIHWNDEFAYIADYELVAVKIEL